MSNFLHTLRTVTLGAAHDVLDKAIDMNSPSALRQYVRDLEDALGHMQDEAAKQEGFVRNLIRQRDDMQKGVDQLKAIIAHCLAAVPPKKEAAEARAREVVSQERFLKDVGPKIEAQQKALDSINDAVAKIKAKHAEYLQKVRDLERMDQTTKAQESAARAVNAAGTTLANGVDYDSIENRMQQRSDVASARFDRAMGSLGASENDISSEDKSSVDDLLASLAPKS